MNLSDLRESLCITERRNMKLGGKKNKIFLITHTRHYYDPAAYIAWE